MHGGVYVSSDKSEFVSWGLSALVCACMRVREFRFVGVRGRSGLGVEGVARGPIQGVDGNRGGR